MIPFADNSLGPPSTSRCLPLAAAASAPPNFFGSSLHLDCSAMPYQQTPGVCHQVSQLLLLRRQGFSISLHRANPLLRRYLQLLRVAQLFTWVA